MRIHCFRCLAFFAASICLAENTSAQEDACAVVVPGQVFCDDFSDGNAEDGTPVAWSPEWPGLYDASGRDYVFTANGETGSSSPMISSAASHRLTDTSIRARVRFQELGNSIGIEARRDPADQHGYWLAMKESPTARLVLYRNEPGFAQLNVLGQHLLSFDITQQDVLLQLDVIDDNLRGWIWHPDEPMPSLPQIDVQDVTFAEGVPSLWITTNDSGGGVGAFRWVKVATTHIPEPSTAVLAWLGFSSILISRQYH